MKKGSIVIKVTLVVLGMIALGSIRAQAQSAEVSQWQVQAGLAYKSNFFVDDRMGLSVEILYTPKSIQWLSLGFNYSYQDFPTVMNVGKALRDASNYMFVLRGNWLNRPVISLYSEIQYGFYPALSGKAFPQITPLGITFGRKVYGFVEGGAGMLYKGVRAGIGYRF